MQQNEQVLASAPYRDLALRMCVPSILIMLVTVFYNMADTFFIGQSGDPDQLAAVSLCGPLFSVLTGLGTLFGNGGCTAISLALGKGDRHQVQAVSAFCFLGVLVIGLVFPVVVLLFLEPVCYAMGADESTLSFSCAYLRIIAMGAPFILFNTIFAGIIRADGAAVNSMLANLLGTAANILLDALFILFFSWGVEGAALATVFGNALSCVYLTYYILRKQPAFSIDLRKIRWETGILLPVITLGLPMSCSTLLMSLSHILSNNLMMAYGTAPLAAQGIAGKTSMLTSMLIMGICMGLQPAISFNHSSGNQKRVHMIVKTTCILTVGIGVVLSIVFFFARDNIISSFMDDAEVIAYGHTMILAALIPGSLYGIFQMCQTFLQSTGKASYAILLSLLDKGLIYIPCLYLLNHFLGLYGIVYAPLVTLLLSMGAGILLCLKWNHLIQRSPNREITMEVSK